ncbi:nitrilase-related carbon-nitrogen hydrolase [Paenibacillus thalictri]|uniref:CN hydrolase domain-containing protein n=1 Tax=Paenibacillus thalictri TaxID=2527873 RepID=A0A4Q9DIP1_9BACL|nr:nitrilase-related carbon-nitrogen hydrolase [Paenibacillus thalictri]TBL70550.1 hypothetical protein EYB31_33055 [Paenibacillus thalictri]
MNYIDYKTASNRDPEEAHKVYHKLEREWASHLRPHQVLYTTRSYITVDSGTKDFYRELILSSKSLNNLLLRMVSLLQVLDRQLLKIKTDYNLYYKEELPIETRYGDLVPVGDSVLLLAIQGHPSYRRPIDPNYLLLSNNVQSFHLAKPSYTFYQVKHRHLNTPTYTPENVLDLKIGFLPGKFDVSFDYQLHTDSELDDDGLRPFYFKGVSDPQRYYSHVMGLFEQLLEHKPDMMMLPELFTPPDLREQLVQRLRESASASDKLGEDRRPFLFLSGSFHENIDDHIFNAAQITSGNGKELSKVYKMNRFILQRSEDFKGELAPFVHHDGVEKNAYDRREITLFESSLGRIAIFICIDFLSSQLEEVLLDRKVDVILVMAMTPNPASGKFTRRMQELAERNGAVVIVCNHFGKPEADTSKVDKEARVVVSLPGFKQVYWDPMESGVCTIRQVIENLTAKKQARSGFSG